MTDREIEKALELHNNGDLTQCPRCPYFGNFETCVVRLLRDVGVYVKKHNKAKQGKKQNERV